MTSQAITRKSGLNTHIAPLGSNNALPSLPVLSQAAIDRAESARQIREALALLAPWRPGKISPETMRQYRNGTRRAPPWLLALLGERLGELEQRARDARARLADYSRGRGRGAGLRDYWRDRKTSENAALSEAVRKTGRL